MIKLPLPSDTFYYFTDQSFSTKVLYPEEQLCIKEYEPKRLYEFCTGRYCAHKSLEPLKKEAPVIKQPNGAPLWPKHIVGSISHSQKLTGAIVASRDAYESIGLDIETIGRIDYDLWELLFTPNEIELLKRQPSGDHKYLSTLFFSMKEAFYKMQFPFTENFMDFHDCEVIQMNGKYSLKILEEEYSTLNNIIKYDSQHIIYNDQIITYVTALN